VEVIPPSSFFGYNHDALYGPGVFRELNGNNAAARLTQQVDWARSHLFIE